MKKYLFILLAVSIFLSALAGCDAPDAGEGEAPVTQGGAVTEQASNFPAEPPHLHVSDGSTTVTAWRGTYSWLVEKEDGTGAGITTDTPHPLDCKEGIPSLKIAKRASLTFSFEESPTSITVRRYRLNTSDYNAYEEIPVDGSSIEVKPGKFLYEVIVTWNHLGKPYSGTVYYAFSTIN